jgi:hypothetical protein
VLGLLTGAVATEFQQASRNDDVDGLTRTASSAKA